MGDFDQADEGDARADATDGGEGDVEAAGETTAASAITGPDDTRPVGADTLVKVAGDPKVATRDDD